LDVTYMGVEFFGRLQMMLGGGRRVGVDVFGHHGTGARSGGGLTSVEKCRAYANANVYVMGHNHFRGGIGGSVMEMDSMGNVGVRPQVFLRSGTFLRSCKDRVSSYPVDMVCGPSDLGCVWVDIEPYREKRGRRDVVGFRLSWGSGV
jgi:hypothetical protein